MARVGGRNAAFAWIVGVGCVAVLGLLAVLAVPMLPASLSWLGNAVDRPGATSAPAVDAGDGTDGEAAAPPAECRQLYDDALWAALRRTPEAILTPSLDQPDTTASALVSALQPQVAFTCLWYSDLGTVSTTLATVPSDAGSIAAAALPANGFACTTEGERARCTRTDGELTETIEAGAGRWLSTSERSWHPEGYVARTAGRVWP